MRGFSAFAFIITAALPAMASATGNVDCVIEEPGLNVTFEALYSLSSTSTIFQSRAEFALSDPKFTVGTWTVKMDQSNLKEQRFSSNDLKLTLHARHDDNELTLAIEALRKSEDDSEFEGSYRLAIGAKIGSDLAEGGYLKRGRVSCMAG
jgi:hypothetical protein